jgi:outer membrane phospholipase A
MPFGAHQLILQGFAELYNGIMSAPIRLTNEQQQMLTRLAVQSGKPWEDVLRDALASYDRQSLASNGAQTETVYAAMVRLGLLGCVKDGPADLSMNPRYMEGFGSRGG